jgi:hypothetical protein
MVEYSSRGRSLWQTTNYRDGNVGTMTIEIRRPRTVTIALVCFGPALIIGVFIITFAWGEALAGVLTFLVVTTLAVLSARRHNWARWTLTIVTLVSFVLMQSLLRFQLSYGAGLGIATGLQILLEIVGCALLFVPPSNRWYART